MAAEGGNDVVWFTYTGADDEVIDEEATHITVGEGVTFVRGSAFEGWEYDMVNDEYRTRNTSLTIVEFICHDKVEKIESFAFNECHKLRRAIMPGVKIIEHGVFCRCTDLMDVECEKLEIIGQYAFENLRSLRSINLPSARIVRKGAFQGSDALKDVNFGSKLERIGERAFYGCFDLERITIPLKEGESLFTADNIFQACEKLERVTLVEEDEATLQRLVAALHLEQWRNDMNEEIDSVNQILPTARAGEFRGDYDHGGKAEVIRRWIRSVLDKIAYYQVEHRCILEDVAATLQLALPRDIVVNNVLPFLKLPAHTFE